MANAVKIKAVELKEMLEGIEKRVADYIPSSAVKRYNSAKKEISKSVKRVEKEVTKTFSRLEEEAKDRLTQAMKFFRVPSKAERTAARRSKVNAAARTFGLVTTDELNKLSKKVTTLKKQLNAVALAQATRQVK